MEICNFFEFDEYEVYSLVRKMASELYVNGEMKILSGKPIAMNPLQVFNSCYLSLFENRNGS